MVMKLRVTYKKSAIGYSERQKSTVRSLGLKRLGQVVELPDNPAIRGMVLHVRHLVTLEEHVLPEEQSQTVSRGGDVPAAEHVDTRTHVSAEPPARPVRTVSG